MKQNAVHSVLIYIPIWRIKDINVTINYYAAPKFTFQYGGLRTQLCGRITQPIRTFTFQYGGLRTVNEPVNILDVIRIYIPIWRIKDAARERAAAKPPRFTFQYGGLRT